MNCQNLKNNKGFTMVELIIVIAILSFGIIGIYSFSYPASILTSSFSLRLTAAYLAQDGLEIINNIRDNNVLSGKNWSGGFNVCDTGCELDYKTGTSVEAAVNILKKYNNNFLNINADGFYSYDTGSTTKFKRKVTITQPSANTDILKVDVLVTWDYNGQSFSFNTIGYIYNY